MLPESGNCLYYFSAVAAKRCKHSELPRKGQYISQIRQATEKISLDCENAKENFHAQSWTALFRAFSSHRQPSASFENLRSNLSKTFIVAKMKCCI